MWKKIVAALGASFFLFRWSRRLFVAWRVSGRASPALVPSPGMLALYVLFSSALLFAFWKTEGAWSRRFVAVFIVLQVVSVGIAYRIS